MSILDSGGDNGRHFQRNQGRDFENEPESVLTFRWGYADLTFNLYHWLTERLTYDSGADTIFSEWANNEDNEHKNWFLCTYEFMDYLAEPWTDWDAGLASDGDYYRVHPEVTGLYGEGDPMVINTFNNDNFLSQTIQFTYFEIQDSNILADGIYILLSVHGGADVRGGYTQPRMFVPNDMHDDEAILFPSDGTITCPACNTQWVTDDAYNWHCEHSLDDAKNLNNHKVVEVKYETGGITEIVAEAMARLNEFIFNNAKYPTLGIVAEGDEGFCPACGEGILEGYG